VSSWLRIGLAIALVALVLAFADWRAVWAVLSTVDLAWVAAAAGLAACDRVIVNYRWQVLLAALRVKAEFWPLMRIQLAANFAGSFLPSSLGVDALRVTALVQAGEPSTPVIASTLFDRFSLAFASLLFGSVMLLVLAGARVPPDVANAVFAATAVGLLACALCLLGPVRRWGRLELLPRVPERVRARLGAIAEATLAYRHHWSAVATTIVVTLGLFAVRIMFAKSLGLACGVNVGFLDLLLVIPLLWIVVMLPITIGSIGVQDAGYVVLMGLVGVDPAVAVSMSLIEHVVSRAVSLPGVLFVGDFIRKVPRQEQA
jgi:uncharacterized protein (TIRG00374 family)